MSIFKTKVSAIVAAAGSSRRMCSKINKPFIKLCGKELLFYVLKQLEASALISEVIIAARRQDISRIRNLIKKYGFSKINDIVVGGKERSQSVFNALLKVASRCSIVLVHDVARPFITQKMIEKTTEAARRYGAAVASIAVKPTIKEAKHNFIKRTLDRKILWEAQTPQVFKKDILMRAYKKAAEDLKNFTDEASLVEAIDRTVKIVEGSPYNIKITTPEDLVIAEAIIKNSKFKMKNEKL